MTSLTGLPAPAKLNVFLRVVGRRQDGYHLLQSLFVLLDWQDTLHLERRADGLVRRRDSGVALPEQDLCVRAARILQEHSGCRWGVDISIEKRIPMGAGMGGGSSDAATVLLALNRLWELGCTRAQLAELGVRLGADVPFFIGGANAIVQGIGEELHPVALRPRRYLVVKPPVEVLTRTIFADPSLKRDSKPATLEGFLADPSVLDRLLDSQPAHGGYEIGNDLQGVAVRHAAPVGHALEWLESRWGNSLMTGSGSAVFARETDANARLMAAAERPGDPEGLPDGWVGRWCRSLPEHPLADWAG